MTQIFRSLGDACLEEVNKKLKYWLPDTGVPDTEEQLKATRLLEKMEEVKTLFTMILI